MSKSIISEGKTTNEAIEKGLKELKVSKNDVEIKILENEDKRSFFDILAPRIVKVELIVKEVEKKEEKEILPKKQNFEKNQTRIDNIVEKEELDKATENIKTF